MKVYFRHPDHTELLQSHGNGFRQDTVVTSSPTEGHGILLSIKIPKPVFIRYEHPGAKPRTACIPAATLNRFLHGLARVKAHALVAVLTACPMLTEAVDAVDALLS